MTRIRFKGSKAGRAQISAPRVGPPVIISSIYQPNKRHFQNKATPQTESPNKDKGAAIAKPAYAKERSSVAVINIFGGNMLVSCNINYFVFN